MIAKLDLKKAYDRMEWPFVNKALEAWAFSSDVRRMIFNCISSVEYEILVNGSSVGKVESAKGLKQRGLLSPYLFYSLRRSALSFVRCGWRNTGN